MDYVGLSKVRVPVLDLYGENDFPQVLAAGSRRRTALEGIAGSRQLSIAGADHYYTGREQALAAAIAAFLAGLP